MCQRGNVDNSFYTILAIAGPNGNPIVTSSVCLYNVPLNING